MKNLKFSMGLLVLTGSLLAVAGLRAQESKPAREIVRTAMQAELAADLNDHSRWRYRDDQRDGTNTVSIVVETDHGSVKRVINRNGQPLSEAEVQVEDQRVQSFIHDLAVLAKQKKDG